MRRGGPWFDRRPVFLHPKKFCPATKSFSGPKYWLASKVLPDHRKSVLLDHLTRYFDGDISDSSPGQIPPHYSWNNDKTRSDQNTAIRQRRLFLRFRKDSIKLVERMEWTLITAWMNQDWTKHGTDEKESIGGGLVGREMFKRAG